VTTDDFPKDKFLVFATANGTVKKTASASTTSHAARDGSPSTWRGATKSCAWWRERSEDLMVVTYRGMAIRFQEAKCVKSVATRWACAASSARRRKAISLDVVRDDADLFVVTDTGFGKARKSERFNRQGRGGRVYRAIN